jgi:ActR/RegA family two-component response regulator
MCRKTKPPQRVDITARQWQRIRRLLKNKHQAVSQGVRRFGKHSILNDM